MSCRRFQFELSECLDGRLASARRTEVMAHVDSCPQCAEVWEEMQSAQALVLGLTEHRVDPGFREAVWDRIHSGEGAPAVLLQEPVGMATKVRYGMVGAAAAALLLVTFHVMTRSGGSEAPREENQIAGHDSAAPDGPTAPKGPDAPGPEGTTPKGVVLGPKLTKPDLRASDRSAPDAGTAPTTELVADMTDGLAPQPLNAANLANHTIKEVSGAATRLRRRSRAVLTEPAKVSGPTWVDVHNDVQLVHDGLRFLQTLEREDLIAFSGPSRACIADVAATFRSYKVPKPDQRELQQVVRTLTSCSLDGLPKSFQVPGTALNLNARFMNVLRQEFNTLTPMFKRMHVHVPSGVVFSQGQQMQVYFFTTTAPSAQWQTRGRVNYMPRQQPAKAPSKKLEKRKR